MTYNQKKWASILAWGIFIFAILILIANGFVKPMVDMPWTLANQLLVVFPICLVLSTILTFVSYRIMLKSSFGDVERKQLSLFEKVLNKGVNEELAAEIEKQYLELAKTPDSFSVTFNLDALYLAGYYSDREEYEKAYYYINSVRLNELKRELATKISQMNYVNYYVTKLLVECEAADRTRADQTYKEAYQVFEQYGQNEQMKPYIDIALSAYEILVGRYSDALERLKATKSIPSCTAQKLINMGKTYYFMGDIANAKEYYERAVKEAKGEYSKNLLMEDMKKKNLS